MLLTDKVAIVTGARSGIGRAIAMAFAAAGASVVAADISDASDIVLEMQTAGAEALAVHCDISDPASVQLMIERTLDRFGGMDVLVNNAGIFPFSPVETLSVADWDRVFAVNARGTFLCSKAVIPIMRQRGAGKIINIGSSTFFQGLANSAAYVASKGAVIGFTRALARELGAHNIQVNTLTPGLTRTDGVVGAGVTDEFFAHFAALQCLPRTETPRDIVGAAVFLASSGSDFMTGQIVNVDGGLNTY